MVEFLLVFLADEMYTHKNWASPSLINIKQTASCAGASSARGIKDVFNSGKDPCALKH